MRKSEFEHLIAAAAEITGEEEIVVIGSQAILGSFPNPPRNLLRSIEVDVYPRGEPRLAEAIDGALGDGSPFQRTFGYYAHGVGPETAKAPAGWKERWVRVAVPRRPGRDGDVHALCIEVHDLVLAKCVAGRKRDWEFAEDVIDARLVKVEILIRRSDSLPIDDAGRRRVRRHLEGLISKLERRRLSAPG